MGKTLPNCIGCGRFINTKADNTLFVFAQELGISPLHKECINRYALAFTTKPATRYGIVKLAILDLRSKGYGFNRIVRELGCSRSTVSYHLSAGQKDKSYMRNLKRKFRLRTGV